MRVIKLMVALLVLGIAACSTAPSDPTLSASLLIDQPTPPFPYNSRICP